MEWDKGLAGGGRSKFVGDWKLVRQGSVRTAIGANALALLLILLSAGAAWAAGGGSLSGVARDPNGGVIAGAQVSVVNTALKTEFRAISDEQGVYSFPVLPVGHYDLTIEATGFRPQKKTGIAIDADSNVKLDVAMAMAEVSEQVTVSSTAVDVGTEVETAATQLGDIVESEQIAAIPLNGRSYTDLLAIQPGVSPVTTQTATSVIMAGVTGTINPSGDANPGDVSIDGARESDNGFMVNGIDVKEGMNGGTAVIPNLDSIDQFRVLTNNFDPEYGNYDGGMINVVTKSGSNSLHGDVFEYLRNTSLDAKNFFDSTRGAFRQNQFGGVLGGPIKRDKVFFFIDYQGTRTTQGISSTEATVLSNAERTGNFSDAVSSLTGTVSGPNAATLLTNELGYTVTGGEPYYLPNCTSKNCVFPNALIPMSAWSAPAKQLLQYIPQPNIGSDQFTSSAFAQTVRDDKAGSRIDANTRLGSISGYYYVDDYSLDNPYPGAQGGASIPGFDAINEGRSQEFAIGDTKVVSSSMVNELHIGYLRNSNNIGKPRGGLGVSLASQGFSTNLAAGGIDVQAPQYEGVENIVFPSFVMGVPVTNVNQWNNSYFVSDAISKVLGQHTLKFGGEFHYDQVNENPNGTFNGTFTISGTETGNAFADFLLGFPSQFTQSTGQSFYLRDKYASLFGEDSWRARTNLTVNYGVRWDLIEPWSEKYNNLQTIVPGQQSVLFPNAPPDLVVAGDPGIPSTISPAQLHNFAPRIGVAYSPSFSKGWLRSLFGSGDKSSIRASFGQFYTAFPGLSAGILFGVPPFGYNYLSPTPPLLATPFIDAADGIQQPDPYPFKFPPHNISQQSPYTGFNFAGLPVPAINAAPYWFTGNKVPYTENYMLSFQRQITTSALVTISYSGNQGHHELALLPTNAGNPALCLTLSGCGPYAEDGLYTSPSGAVIHGTRTGGFGPDYGSITAQKTIANSNYNALEGTLRLSPGTRSTILLAYTYSKSIDQASNLGEQLNPFDQRATRAISAWDMTNNFVATYNYRLPFERLKKTQWTEGWTLSGTTRLSSGLPVTLFDDSDSSLLGTFGNGVNNYLLDTPERLPGPLNLNTNPRNGQPAFNTSVLVPETLGQLGNASRRFFHGPGIYNFDMQLNKEFTLTESKLLDFKIQAFNVFNHAQFYGPASVDGEVEDSNFGRVVSAAAPRLVQVALKVSF